MGDGLSAARVGERATFRIHVSRTRPHHSPEYSHVHMPAHDLGAGGGGGGGAVEEEEEKEEEVSAAERRADSEEEEGDGRKMNAAWRGGLQRASPRRRPLPLHVLPHAGDEHFTGKKRRKKN